MVMDLFYFLRPPLPEKKYDGFSLCIQFNVDQVPNINLSFNHYGVLLNRLRTLSSVTEMNSGNGVNKREEYDFLN